VDRGEIRLQSTTDIGEEILEALKKQELWARWGESTKKKNISIKTKKNQKPPTPHRFR